MQHRSLYGNARVLRFDNGSHFVNETIREFTELVGTEHVQTLAYSKEENAIVERANKEVMRYMRDLIFDKNISSDWEDNLPQIQRLMNTTA